LSWFFQWILEITIIPGPSPRVSKGGKPFQFYYFAIAP